MQRFLVPCRLIKIFLMLRSLFFLVHVFKPGTFKLIQGQILRELTFYQGECPLCEDALIDLANKYKRLAEKNLRVIAISAQKTEQGFQKRLAYHQWPENLCDFSGISGQWGELFQLCGIGCAYSFSFGSRRGGG
jgi:hypothetical protein